MAKRIAPNTYQVANGIIVQPIFGKNERRDGCQIIIDHEYEDNFRLKRDAVAHAEKIAAAWHRPTA